MVEHAVSQIEESERLIFTARVLKTCAICGNVFSVSSMRAHAASERCLVKAGRVGRYWHQTRGEQLVKLYAKIDKLLELDVAEGQRCLVKAGRVGR